MTAGAGPAAPGAGIARSRRSNSQPSTGRLVR